MRLIVLATAIFISTATINAQTYFEGNAEDVKCQWQDINGVSGTDTCHITAQGTNMGETITVFRIGNRKPEYTISDSGIALLSIGKNNKILWKGKSKQKWVPLNGTSAIQVITISDGMTVKLFRK
jgi:hypothetical protein